MAVVSREVGHFALLRNSVVCLHGGAVVEEVKARIGGGEIVGNVWPDPAVERGAVSALTSNFAQQNWSEEMGGCLSAGLGILRRNLSQPRLTRELLPQRVCLRT